MGMAKARRIAADAHRGQLLAGGGLVVDHLERVARTVSELTDSPVARQAAWLYAVRGAGLSVWDLYRMDIPAKVVDIVNVLPSQPVEPLRHLDYVLTLPDAALVRFAVLVDWYVHVADEWGRTQWHYELTRIVERLGLPWPSAVSRVTDEPKAVQVDPPTEGGHWDQFAQSLSELRDVRSLPVLLTGYHEVVGDDARSCCLQQIRAAVSLTVTAPRNAGSPVVDELIERWWNSADSWEVFVAVSARSAARDPAHRPLLLDKVAAGPVSVVQAAIEGLHGAGDSHEVELLRRVVAVSGPDWRWARHAAAVRLIEIGGPEADAALGDRHLSPLDPPWRDDPTWLAKYGTQAIPVLVENLSDPQWWHDATYALGELRADEAVGALCAAVAAGSYPASAIVALAKIGSADAVPTLIECLDDSRAEVRDHALLALDRIGCPGIVDLAIAACGDPEPFVRVRAARVLARHGDERAVPTLIVLCDGRHAAIAVDALVRIGDPRALPTLWYLFQHSPEKTVRHTAGRGLVRIDGPRTWIQPWNDVRVRRAHTWLLGHKPQWDPGRQLQRAVDDDDPLVRAHAVRALARLGDPAGAEPVRGRLADPDPQVRANAATALGRLGGAGDRNLLDARLADPHADVRSAAAAALRRLSGTASD